MWATFGLQKIKPFDENYTREQMKNWKASNSKVHEDLYATADSSDSDETYLSLIVKKVFVSDEEQTKKNAKWCQAILEIIFDKSYLSPKIDVDTIDKWYSTLVEVNSFCYFCCFCHFINFINCILTIIG